MLATATELRDSLAGAPLPLALDGVAAARSEAAAAARQLDDYVLPRLRDVDAPALAVVGGSTGSGKSTLVNSLLGEEVSRPGVLRPTTRSPVLVHHPDSAHWFSGDRILPSLPRLSAPGPAPAAGGAGSGQLELVARPSVPPDLALLDAPDIDSVVDANRRLASQLLDAADLWIFVTTAARYADAVPWAFLRRAVARGVGIALVLNRVPPGAAAEVGSHLAEMLAAEGLGHAPVFTVEEQPLVEGRLPDAAVAPLSTWLRSLAADHAARTELIRRTLLGTISELAARTDAVATAVDQQAQAVTWLRDTVGSAFNRAADRIAADVRDGTVMRGEVLARWQDLVGTGELLRQLQSALGRWRDRIGAALTGRATNGERFQGAVTSGVETLVLAQVAEAVDEVGDQWRSRPAGAAILESAGHDFTRPSADLGERTARLVRDWQEQLLELIRREGGGRQRTAKALSYGVNGVALVLMVGVFAQTGGLTGAEVAIAGGGSAVGQKLLEALLGDQAVRRLAAEAREDLERRVDDLLAAEAARFTTLLDAGAVPASGDRLRDLAGRLRRQAAA